MYAVTRYRTLVGRSAGAFALLSFAVLFVSIGLGPSNVLFGDVSSQTAIAYVAQHQGLVTLLGTLDGLYATLLGILIVLLIAVAGAAGILPRIAYVCAGAAVAIQWTHAGILYGLADIAHRGGADQGLMALFTLGSTMDDADSVVISIAVLCAGWLLWRSHRAPAFVGWLTLAVAAFQAALEVLAKIGGPDLGPALIVSSWLWSIGIGITLLIKPVASSERPGVVAPATAC